jgi:hypothetical protein
MTTTSLQPTPVLPAAARIWQFVVDRQLGQTELAQITEASHRFCATWTAHNHLLRADAFTLFDQILVLAVDESTAGASGCSIDKATHFVEGLGQELGIDFFTRDRVFFQQSDRTIGVAKLGNLSDLVKQGALAHESLVFDTVATTFGQMTEQGWKPLSESWQKRWM